MALSETIEYDKITVSQPYSAVNVRKATVVKKDNAEIAKIDGVVGFDGMSRGKRKLIITNPETGEIAEHLIPRNKHITVYEDDVVKRADLLTDGPVVPHEILEILGTQALMEHLVFEVQEVYRLQGVEINDKHLSLIHI